MLATAKRLQQKYEKKEERRKNGRKAAINTTTARDCSVGALRLELKALNEKRVQKAHKKARIAADKTARIARKAIKNQSVSNLLSVHTLIHTMQPLHLSTY